MKKIGKIHMEVMWKVFSCEGNQYWFEKQLQGRKGKKKKKEASTLPRKTELNLQQQKDRGDTGKAGK